MKRLLLPVFCLLLLAACNRKPENKSKVAKVDAADNSVISKDSSVPSSKVVFESMEDSTTEENSTGRFAPAGHKKLIMDNSR